MTWFFMSKTIRTFIAIEIPKTVISKIRELQGVIKAYGFKIRWVRAENIHLTLKFLGDIEEIKINEIAEAVSKTAEQHSPISLKAKGIGVFPGIKRPHVLWVGLSGQLEALIKLQQTLDENLIALGFSSEERPFKGHLTMGRIKDRIDVKKLGDALMAFRRFESETFTAGQIILYKSELTPSGAIYTKLASASIN
jgi:RNA 2',3'-cyclic 3'-phosphodiesterase